MNATGLSAVQDLNHYTAYAFMNIISPQDHVVKMGVGSDDAIKVWLNGGMVHRNNADRKTSGIQDKFDVNLKAGNNPLLVKVNDNWENWGMFFKIYLEPTEYKTSIHMTGELPSVAADVNEDGQVDIHDLILVIKALDETGNTRVDVNRDGKVNKLDLLIIVENLDDAVIPAAPVLREAFAAISPETFQMWLNLLQADSNGSVVYHKTLAILHGILDVARPPETALLPNYPNPFNPETWIPYHLSKGAEVTLHIYAVNGILVRQLSLGHQPAGLYQNRSRAAYWDGRNALGEPVASGVYFYTLTAGDFTATRKMLIRKEHFFNRYGKVERRKVARFYPSLRYLKVPLDLAIKNHKKEFGMKTLSSNRKIVMSIVIVMVLIYGIQTTSHGQQQFTPVSDRTPQVRDAIVALVPGVDAADDVTAAHLSLMNTLNLSEQNITTLKAGDFDGLSSLDSLALYKNELSSLPVDIFSELSSLRKLDLGNNMLRRLPADIFSELSSLEWLSLPFNQLNSLSVDTFSGLSSLNTLNLSYNKLSSLSAGHFAGLSSLRTLNLSSNKLSGLPSELFSDVPSLSWLSLSFNELSGLPVRIFSGLSTLRSFYLGDNAVNLSITVFLEQIEENEFKATAPTGAPFNIVLPLSVLNGAIDGGATTIEIPAGSVESEPLTVTPTPGASDPVAVDIVVFPELPIGHYGYSLAEPSGLGGDDESLIFAVGISRPNYEPNVNHAPVFAEGISTMRSVAENTDAGVNIGSPVVATDEDDDPLTYGLEGPDAVAFGIVGTTGQLQTRAPLDYETRDAYAVTVIVTDGRGGADTIGVVINVTDENDDPIFIEGDSTTRAVAENTEAGINIGGAVSATDEDGDPLTYTLGGIDAASFGIVGTTGQLQTRVELDYETKDAYSVTVMVSDGNGGTDIIGVAISVTDENDDPIFVEGDGTTRSVAENTDAGVNIGAPVSATDEDGDTLIYSLGGVDAGSFGIVGASGQLRTRAPLDYETKNAYSVVLLVSDGEGGTDTIGVAISVTDEDEDVPDEEPAPVVESIVIPKVDTKPETHAPAFPEDRTTRSIAENTPAGRNIGSPVSATDADDDTLTYTLGGTNATSFSIVPTSGQLQTKVPLDYETKNAYSVTVTVSDGGRTDTIIVTITIIDVDETPQTHAPVFAGNSATRSIAENTPAGRNIGSPVSATDADDDTLTYTLGGTNASSFSIVPTSGQLQTHAPLDYETKNAYSVTVTVSDGSRTDTITVAIIIIDVDESVPPPPAQVEGAVTISEIMFGSEIRFSPKQWVEISNTGPKPIDLTGWTLTIYNVNSDDLTGPETMAINFRDSTFDDAPRIWPNDVLLIVTSTTDDNSGGFLEDQIYNLRWIEGARKDTYDISFNTIWLSTEGFRITLTDKDGNLVDEAGNYNGTTTLWDLPYGFNRGRIRAGNRTSIIRRYVDGVALDGVEASGWISAVDVNLTAEQQTYYGDENDISSPGIGIVVNEIAPQFTDYDANQDGVVNILDLVFIAGRFGQSGPNSADVNGDGVVSILDLIKVAGAINQEPAAPSLHPEVLSVLTAADIQKWLIQAHGSDLTDPKLQKGIFFLEQLLSVLVPKETELLPNYPNPFNPETWIPYRLAEDGFVTVTIYDPRGSVVRRFDIGHQTASVYESRARAIYWDGRNEVGDRVASGIYFYTLTAGDYSATRKLVILK